MDYNVIVHLDSAALALMKDNEKFADQLRMDIASKKMNYTFGDIATGKWKGYFAYRLLVTDNNNQSKLSIQMILIGSKMYTLSCRIPSNLNTKNNEVVLVVMVANAVLKQPQ